LLTIIRVLKLESGIFIIFSIVRKILTAPNVALIMLKTPWFVLTVALLFTAHALKADFTGDTDSIKVNITVFTEEAQHLQP
jgi:hypothetical protein